MAKINIVTLKHPNDNTPYTFKVPDNVHLNVGWYVMCDTKKGKDQIGRCITPSFPIDEGMFQSLYGMPASKLMPVTAIMNTVALIYQGQEPEKDDAIP